MFPIYVYEEGTELPDDGTYFVVAANGMFMHKDVGIVKALVRFDADKVPGMSNFEPPKRQAVPVYVWDGESELPAGEDYFLIAKNGVFDHRDHKVKTFQRADYSDVPNLGTLKTHCRFELPKIPTEIIWRSLLFFRRVWYTRHAEAAVILFWNAEKKEYFLHAPRQQVSGGGVSYGTLRRSVPDPEEAKYVSEMSQKGYKRIGTIHSHCNFNAYHSSVDTGDEAEWPDGVHITIGHVDGKAFSLVTSLVVNNNRFQVDPLTLVLGLKRKIPKKNRMGFQAHSDEFFDVLLTDEERETLIGLYQEQIETEWLPRVGDSVVVNTTGNKDWHKNTKWGQQDDEPSTHVSACVQPNLFPVTPPDAAPASAAEAVQPISGNMQQLQEAMGVVPVELPDSEVAEIVELSPTNYLKKVRSHALALKNRPDLPPERKGLLLATLQAFFRKPDVSVEDIDMAAELNPDNAVVYAAKGYAVQ